MNPHVDFIFHLYHAYEHFSEKSLCKRAITHNDVLLNIQRLKRDTSWDIQTVGKSVLGKEIFVLKMGNGSIKVFLWSQMHGDESTATRAIFDIINYLTNPTGFHNIKDDILHNITLYFMPMVNPDGADLFQRRNFLEIDINRDAIRKTSPESQTLMQVFESINPDFAFNLHDQSTLYSVGNSEKQAAISFLAPPYDDARTLNNSRGRAIRAIVGMKKTLDYFIPGHVARYTDEFEPRAFGDTFQSKGASTILIESGGWKDDAEKEYIRKLNCIIILSSLHDVAAHKIEHYSQNDYFETPVNDKLHFDVLLRNLTMKRSGGYFNLDIGINFYEALDANERVFIRTAKIEDSGDLSVFHGVTEHDFTGFELLPETIFPKQIKNVKEFNTIDPEELLQKGFMGLMISENIQLPDTFSYPMNVYYSIQNSLTPLIQNGKTANFRLIGNENEEYFVLNGYIYNRSKKIGSIKNGIIHR